MKNHIFISYPFQNGGEAERVVQGLELAGLPCWLAARDLPPEANLAETIVKAIAACDAFVVLLSENSNRSDFLRREVERAHAYRKCMIPVVLDDVKLSQHLEYHLACLHFIDARSRIDDTWIAEVRDCAGRAVELACAHASKSIAGCEKTRPEAPAPAHPTRGFDVFISYRRERDSQTARLIRAELQRRHFRVFLDVDDLRPGYFDEALIARIEEAPSFIVILSAGSLDRCATPEDWLRRELLCALTKRKRIIPILMPGFSFPAEDRIPPELRPIRLHHGVSYSHDFFDAMMQKVVDYLVKGDGS